MAEIDKTQQVKQENKIDLSKDIYVKDIVDLQQKLVYIVKETGAIQYDECTGNYLVQYGHLKSICNEKEAQAHFRTMFLSHCYIKKTEANGDNMKQVTEKVSRDMLNDVFMVVGKVITFNSRIEFYDSIPAWDGVKRMDTFMKDLYDCDANPKFWWLFVTSVLGKIKDPKGTYVPFFFDFVGNKGVGKSYLCPTLFGEDLVQILQPCSRPEDVYTQIYQFGAVIGIDDELKITGEKAQRKLHSWTHDELKAFVTCTKDTFSRKGMQLETHPRAFVFVRTSNEVRISTEPDERRQIIFESNLPALECRLFDHDQNFYDQVLAEAKEYLEKNGVYKLDETDWEYVREQQSLYLNTESTRYRVVENFINLQINRIKLHSPELTLKRGCDYYYFTWNDFFDYWTKELHRSEDSVLGGTLFWKLVDSYRLKTHNIMRDTIYERGRKNKIAIAQIIVDQI